ncbi:MFS transporter [Alicyclobacillus fastidiosus]|uniref:MFS transporter n=1 Tax=Alicyclobacillus fastidiosus TaxID=392011 RepID=A0ABV5AHM3_9BACL|nr:MFS transporter [Alicyclobacillus fastidiosus]WEH09150.1 hypothetical protein PYS47_21140 [Alicyclobacillus fastidiosus]
MYTHHSLSLYRRNIVLLYVFQATSHLWFDGALWVIYWQHRGVSLFVIGLLEALLHLVSLTLDIPMGIVADRVGWKYTLFLSGLAGCLYCGLSLLPSDTLFGAFAAFACRGLQLTLASGSDMAITYETVAAAGYSSRYQSISGRMMATQLLAVGFAEACGGWLAGIDWTYVYGLFAIANLVSAGGALLLAMPNRQRAVADLTGEAPLSFVQMIRTSAQFARRNASYRRWVTFGAILSGAISTCTFYGQSFLHACGWTTGAVGMLTGIECGVSALAAAGSSRITQWLRVPGIAAVTAGGMALFAWLPPAGKGIGYLLAQATGSAADPLIDQRLNTILPNAVRATLLSGNSTAFSLFMVIVFPSFGLLADQIGTETAYQACSAILAAAVAVTVLLWIGLQLRRGKGCASVPSESLDDER